MRILRILATLACLTFSCAAFAGANYTNLEKMGGWQSCTTCAGAGGNGPSATFSMWAGVSSPSLNGASTQFNLGGHTGYSDALWWKQLGGNSSASNFVYDVYFYLKNPSVSQALEFDVNQSVGGKKYIFGTQCDIRGNHVWDVWDTANHRWTSTGIGCSLPSAYAWHHLTWEFQRTGGGKANFVSMTLDGVKHYINRSFYAQSSGVSEINVAFQMDGDGHQNPYSVWINRVGLNYW